MRTFMTTMAALAACCFSPPNDLGYALPMTPQPPRSPEHGGGSGSIDIGAQLGGIVTATTASKSDTVMRSDGNADDNPGQRGSDPFGKKVGNIGEDGTGGQRHRMLC